MRKILLALMITLVTFGMLVTDAEAKRFGGGRSFGMTRNTSNFSTNSYRPSAAPAAAAAAKPASRWLGPLAGLAIGGLLGSLFMSHGLGSGLLSWLLIGGAIFLVWRLFANRVAQPVTQPNMQQNRTFNAEPIYQANTTNTNSRPLGFDDASFLRNAKSLYLRLQAAYDSKNLADLREFTAPEVFAEIQLQLHERGNETNVTEVVSLDAQLLDVSNENGTEVASTLFSGMISEEQGAAPVAIKEIWHFRQDGMNNSWVVAGIQQV